MLTVLASLRRCVPNAGSALLSFAGLAAVVLTTVNAEPAAAAQQSQSPILVELFTSQGCSSCPPADAHLGTLTQRDDILALSFNVDYWDYLGWRDTLAKPEFTQRQRTYAKARGDGQIYTPQLIVNGRTHASGANTKAVGRLLADAASQSVTGPEISFSKADGITRVRVAGLDGRKRRATVWLVAVDRKVTTKIKRGENRGRELSHFNVVRQIIPLGAWTGEQADYKLDISMLMKDGAEACAIIVQDGEVGPVIAAAWLKK